MMRQNKWRPREWIILDVINHEVSGRHQTEISDAVWYQSNSLSGWSISSIHCKTTILLYFRSSKWFSSAFRLSADTHATLYVSHIRIVTPRGKQQRCDWSARCHVATQLCAAKNAPGETERLLPAVASSSALFVPGEGNSGVQPESLLGFKPLRLKWKHDRHGFHRSTDYFQTLSTTLTRKRNEQSSCSSSRFCCVDINAPVFWTYSHPR